MIGEDIICNNCLGYRIYELKRHEFMNPFQWCVIKPLDMLYLIENYENIDFSSHRLEYGYFMCGNYYCTVIDGLVRVWWVHHIKDEKYDQPTKVENEVLRNADLRYKDIEAYINEAYDRRVKRMTKNPTFIVNFDNWWGMSNEDVVKIAKSTTKKKDTVLVSSDKVCDTLGCKMSVVLPYAMDYDKVAAALEKGNVLSF